MECRLGAHGLRRLSRRSTYAARIRFERSDSPGEEFSMPFPLIPTALGLCFLLIWAFIGVMIYRDGQMAARREREWEGNILPMQAVRSTTMAPIRGQRGKDARRESAVRFAS
jgi:hypothetical protein